MVVPVVRTSPNHVSSSYMSSSIGGGGDVSSSSHKNVVPRRSPQMTLMIYRSYGKVMVWILLFMSIILYWMYWKYSFLQKVATPLLLLHPPHHHNQAASSFYYKSDLQDPNKPVGTTNVDSTSKRISSSSSSSSSTTSTIPKIHIVFSTGCNAFQDCKYSCGALVLVYTHTCCWLTQNYIYLLFPVGTKHISINRAIVYLLLSNLEIRSNGECDTDRIRLSK
jgi:hypothetical protein